MVSQASATGVRLERVVKRFGDSIAVAGVDLEVDPGETFVLLGSSGSGKTTLLRLIAGLEQPEDGRILLGERDVTSTAPRFRGIGMVFQNYALFPHMRVRENVAYGLRVRGHSRTETSSEVAKALDLVGLSEFAERFPAQLSGGQQQRVALARALVIRPAILLLDEPFGALDFKLRRRMQFELRELLHEVGTTAVHVTHDQEEALALADRLAIMDHGRLEQVGTPEQIYGRPSTAFVAAFLGEANLVPVDRDHGRPLLIVGGARVPLDGTIGEGEIACLRPELLRLTAAVDDAAALSGILRSAVFLGDSTLCEVACGDLILRVRIPAHERLTASPGEEVGVRMPSNVPLVTA